MIGAGTDCDLGHFRKGMMVTEFEAAAFVDATGGIAGEPARTAVRLGTSAVADRRN